MWNNANTSSKQLTLSCSAGMLSTNRPHIHSAACCFTWRNWTKKVPASSTFPKHSPCYWVASPLFSPSFDYLFFLQPWAVSDSPLSSSIAALFCCWASSHSSPVFKQTGRERVRVRGRGWVRGRDKTRLLLLVTQTWLRANTSTMFVLPHSLPPTEWLTLPLALPLPFSHPSLSSACTHSLKAAILAERGSGLAWWSYVFFWFYSIWRSGKEAGGSFWVVLKVMRWKGMVGVCCLEEGEKGGTLQV